MYFHSYKPFLVSVTITDLIVFFLDKWSCYDYTEYGKAE